MVYKAEGQCRPECGVRVEGEVEPDAREFVHRFHLPPGAESPFREPVTEVGLMRLVTFGPAASEWTVECPLCRRPILIFKPGQAT